VSELLVQTVSDSRDGTQKEKNRRSAKGHPMTVVGAQDIFQVRALEKVRGEKQAHPRPN
jgi:hypothetical protein